jgi:hypothetical protein
MRIIRILLLGLLTAACAAQTQPVTQTVAATAICVSIRAQGNSTVGIIVSGTWSGTFTPNVQISTVASAPTVAKKVVPVDSTTAQATVTTNGGYRADVSGFSLFNFCSTGTWTSGTATVTLNVTTPPAASTVASGGGGSGTVTSVSVTTANGVSGSVATATTTPAISLTLGAITPTSVATTGASTFTAASGNTVSNPTISDTLTMLDPGTSQTINWSNSNCSGAACATANEYVSQTYDGTNGAFLISSQHAGTGVQRPLWLGATGAENWGIDTSGEFKPFVDNSKTLGTTSARPSTAFTYILDMKGLLTNYNNVATVGYGATPIRGSVVATAQAAAIATTTAYAVPATSNALFRISGNIDCPSATSTGTVFVTLGWTDTSGTAQTGVSGTAACTTLGSLSAISFSQVIQAKLSTNITYSTTVGGTTPTYDLRFVVEQLTAN